MRLAVLGAGPGGYIAALKAAHMGAEVTIIERDEIGGTCLNRGCIPTKTMIASAEAYAKAKELESFGIDLEGRMSPNMEKIIERKNKVVATQVKGIGSLFKSWNINVLKGDGTFSSSKEIKVRFKDGSEETVTADDIIIATGSRPAQIPSFPFDGKNIISSTEALELQEIPKSLLIVGAGVIGCEFACMYSELGSDVTMIELLPRAVSTEDEAVSKLLERELKKKKIKLLTETRVDGVDVRADGVHVFLSTGKELTAEKVLVSIGRSFNSDGLGLENIGVTVGPRNEIPVNDKLQTNVPDVYAIGDVTGGLLLAHVASTQGMVAAENIMGADRKIDYSVVPAAVFTSPEIASVGLREHQAKERGVHYNTGEFHFRGLGKAHAMGEISGFIKVVADSKSDKILGAHIIGPHASDLIHEFAVAMQTGLTVKNIAGTIHAHPTLAEGIMEASADVHGEAIHTPKK
jgi:dihydrolipoamide dehydrogenase